MILQILQTYKKNQPMEDQVLYEESMTLAGSLYRKKYEKPCISEKVIL